VSLKLRVAKTVAIAASPGPFARRAAMVMTKLMSYRPPSGNEKGNCATAKAKAPNPMMAGQEKWGDALIARKAAPHAAAAHATT
jgi:hypothetical protein